MKSQYNSTNFIVSNVFDIKTKKDHPYFDIIVLHKSIIYFLGYHKVVSINACFWYESNFFPACVSKQDGLVLGTLRYLKQALLFLNLQKIYKIIIEFCYTRKLNNLNPVCTSSPWPNRPCMFAACKKHNNACSPFNLFLVIHYLLHVWCSQVNMKMVHTYPGKFYIQKTRAISNFYGQGY